MEPAASVLVLALAEVELPELVELLVLLSDALLPQPASVAARRPVIHKTDNVPLSFNLITSYQIYDIYSPPF